MFLRALLIISLMISPVLIKAQCLTDFTKLLPEPSINYTQDFGRATALYNNVLAVGASASDTLGRLTGIVNLYKKIGSGWSKFAVLKPSNPLDGLQFGSNIDMTENYIIVSAMGYGGKVYIFKKQGAEWSTSTELTVLTASGTSSFGNTYRFNGATDLSEDEQTLVVADPQYYSPGATTGKIFVYHKMSNEEWSSSLIPKTLLPPSNEAVDFGTSGVAVQGTRIACATFYANGGAGAIYIYNDPSGTFSNLIQEVKLISGSAANGYFMGFNNFVFTPEGIFSSSSATVNGVIAQNLLFFKKPSGAWSDTFSTCAITLPTLASKIKYTPIRLAFNGTSLYCSYQENSNTGKLIKITKASDWCNATNEIIYSDNPTLLTSASSYYFGTSLAADQNENIVSGLTSLPDNANAQLSLKIFSKSGSTWTANSIYNPLKSTAGHFYGSRVLGFEDFMFVSATGDGTAASNAGVVYSYKKVNNAWQKTGKILAPIQSIYDDAFGTALATNGNYLAVGASSFGSYGQALIYKKGNADWSSVSLVQRISPPDSLNPQGSGSYLAMNDQWLITSATGSPLQNEGNRLFLCIYKFNGATWDYYQKVIVGIANPFNKSQTAAVDIENETIVAGGNIIQKNASGRWEIKYQLTPSDPEPIQISPDFTHLVTNGDLFGTSVDITENAIFIGAPGKDYQGTWDVGAVYVYVKKPGSNWSSAREDIKLLPRVKNERELFGYSLKALNNTLIVGAPGADFNKDGVTARNKPGRAYVIQSKDFFWQNIINLVDFTGDSNVKDYFGIEVNLDESDFFVSSTIEDNSSDKLAGSVYVTPTPPIVRLVPPVCIDQGTINLFGYPFSGNWSGPGITDTQNGTFDPQVTGVGVFEITYKTESCFYEGKLQIEVNNPPVAVLKNGQNLEVCEKSNSYTQIGIEPQPDYLYQWYYRKTDADSFTVIQDAKSNQISVNKTGQYQVEVNNGSCSRYSSVMSVIPEKNKIEITSVPAICSTQEKVTLSATPEGGNWKSTNLSIAGNTVNTSNLGNGSYGATYTLTSQTGCIFTMDTELIVDIISKLPYSRSGNLCESTGAQIFVSPSNPGWSYTWSKQNEEQLYEPITSVNSGSQLSLTENGNYQLSIKNDHCSLILDPITVNDKFTTDIFPRQDRSETCALVPFLMTVAGKPNDKYHWQYSAYSPLEMMPLEYGLNELEIKQTGYYQVDVQRGSCSFTGSPKYIQVNEADTLFIPNVFTPNGDNKNELFKISTTLEKVDLKIINRYGKEIFSGDGLAGWDGHGVSDGVYFWQAIFQDCTGQVQKKKGYVQLIH